MRLCWFGTPPTANSTNPWWLLAVSTSLVWTFGDLPIDTEATDSPRSHPNICDSFWCVSVFTNQWVNGVYRIDLKKFTNLKHQSPTLWEWWWKPTPLTTWMHHLILWRSLAAKEPKAWVSRWKFGEAFRASDFGVLPKQRSLPKDWRNNGNFRKIRQVEPTFHLNKYCNGQGKAAASSEALWGKLHDLHEGRVLRELPESLALKLVWILDLSWPVRWKWTSHLRAACMISPVRFLFLVWGIFVLWTVLQPHLF